MSDQTPTLMLVHGAFADSASWNPVIERLHHHGTTLVATHGQRFCAGWSCPWWDGDLDGDHG